MEELAPQLQGRKHEKGFTLVELLVVIVIIGILAAVAVFAVGGITDKGEEAACDATANSVRTASESYRAQNDTYAPTLGDLDPDYIRLDDLDVTGNVITVEGGTVTYVPAGGGVTDTCVAP